MTSAVRNELFYNSIVIGSGQAGTPLAAALAKSGRRTALVESSYIGGCCVNVGCTPTKTLIASGRVAYLTRRAPDYGIHTPGGDDPTVDKVVVDMLKVRERKRNIVNQFRGGNETRTAAAGVDIIMGMARFIKPRTVAVQLNDGRAEKVLTADEVFVNTGERPAPPTYLDGVDKLPPELLLDSTSIQELDKVPGHLVVLGGGYVGLEFGQLFRRLGAEVTIIQRGAQLLPREDSDIAQAMLEILKEDGITVHLKREAIEVKSSPESPIELVIRDHSSTEHTTINGTHLLAAAGRKPNTESLNLADVGIQTDKRGYITVSPTLETTLPGVWALGDVKGPPAFTHISYDDFRILRGNLIEKRSPQLSTTNRVVPYVVFTDPQLGHVGMHERESGTNFPGRYIKVAKMPMSYVARALETDESRGMMKATVDGMTGEILGFSCLGIDGGEVMAVVQTAMIGGVTWERLRDAVWAHPSLAESLNNLWGFLE